MKSECDKCGENALECSCEEMKEMMQLKRKNLENQNAMIDKFWPWVASVQLGDDDE